MGPITKGQLLMISVPVAVLIINYLWPRKKKICVPSDPGDTDTVNPSVRTIENSSIQTENKIEVRESSSDTSLKVLEVNHTNNSPMSLKRCLSAPIPIVLPKERRKSNSLIVSNEELDEQIDRCISSVKMIDPFLEIVKQKNLLNTMSPPRNTNRSRSVSPVPVPENSRTVIQITSNSLSEEETSNLEIQESTRSESLVQCADIETVEQVDQENVGDLDPVEANIKISPTQEKLTEESAIDSSSLTIDSNNMENPLEDQPVEIPQNSVSNSKEIIKYLTSMSRDHKEKKFSVHNELPQLSERRYSSDEGSYVVSYPNYYKKNKNDKGNPKKHYRHSTLQRPVCPAEEFCKDKEYSQNGIMECQPSEIKQSLNKIENWTSSVELPSSVCNGVLSEMNDCYMKSIKNLPTLHDVTLNEAMECPPADKSERHCPDEVIEDPISAELPLSRTEAVSRSMENTKKLGRDSDQSTSGATECPPPEVKNRSELPTTGVVSRKNKRKLKKLASAGSASSNLPQVPIPAEVKVSDTTNITQNISVEENRLLDKPSSSEEISCSINDIPSPTDEIPSSAEIERSSSTGAIPKKCNKKKKFVKLNCDLKDLDKKLREVQHPNSTNTKQNNTRQRNKFDKPDTVKCIPPNENDVQKSRNDSGCEKEDVNGVSRRQSMNESPADEMMSIRASRASLVESVVSNDSGKGCSDIITPPPQTKSPQTDEKSETYGFVIPDAFAGKLIGKKGHFVNYIRELTNATIVVHNHPSDEEKKLCIITGTQKAISKAKIQVEKRLHKTTIEEFDLRTIQPKVQYHMELPCGDNVETQLSYIDTPEHYYIQVKTHPTYLEFVHVSQMTEREYNGDEVPFVQRPINDIICMANINNRWMRVCVESTNEETETAYVKSLDFGGYENVPFSSLKQLSRPWINVPFQAIECYLYNVKPTNGVWCREALDLIKQLSYNRVVYTHIVSYREDGVPLVNCQIMINKTKILYNRELVKRGFAQWVVPPPKPENLIPH